MKTLEQNNLVDLPMSHHDLQTCTRRQLNQRTSFDTTEDFLNGTGTSRFWRDVRLGSAQRGLTASRDSGAGSAAAVNRQLVCLPTISPTHPDYRDLEAIERGAMVGLPIDLALGFSPL